MNGIYKDESGAIYAVRYVEAIGGYKPHRKRKGEDSWVRLSAFRWRKKREDAQADLDHYADSRFKALNGMDGREVPV